MACIPPGGQPCTLPGTGRRRTPRSRVAPSTRVGRAERQRTVVLARKTVQGSLRPPDRPERIVRSPNAPRTSGFERRGFDAGHKQAGRWFGRRAKCAEDAEEVERAAAT